MVRLKKMIAVLVIALSSCSEKVLDYPTSYLSLEKSNKMDTALSLFSDNFEVTECVPLKENDNCYIGGIKRLFCYKDEIYILSSSEKTGLVVFDKQGNYLRKIGQTGKGHGEYWQTCSFAIDDTNKRILLLCYGSILKVYDFEGNFIVEKKLSDSALWEIACLNGLILCSTNHQTYLDGDDAKLFYIFDEKFNLIEKHTSVLPYFMGTPSFAGARLKTCNNGFYFFDFWTHTLQILNMQGQVEQTIKFEKTSLLDSKYFREVGLFNEYATKNDFIFDNVVLQHSFVTIYTDEGKVRLAVHDKSGNLVLQKKLRPEFPKFFQSEGDQIIGFMTLDQVKSNKIPSDSMVSEKEAFFYIVKCHLRKLKR